MALGHLHRLIDGGAMRDLIHKQDLISADPQDIQDQRLQPLRLLRAPQTDIVVQIHAVLDHAVGDTAGQCCVAAVQAVFGDGPLQAAVRPCVGTGDAQQHLQRGIAGIALSLLVHTFVFTGWPARYAAAGIRLPPWGCNSRIRSSLPSPQATAIPFLLASTMVPGAAAVSSPTAVR